MFYPGPYGNFGKVDDFKVVGAKSVAKGKRTYRQGRPAAVATAAMAVARANTCFTTLFSYMLVWIVHDRRRVRNFQTQNLSILLFDLLDLSPIDAPGS